MDDYQLTSEDVSLATDEVNTDLAYEEPVAIESGLGFTDGFQFGCGFWTAGIIVFVIAGIAFLLFAFILSFAGINLLG